MSFLEAVSQHWKSIFDFRLLLPVIAIMLIVIMLKKLRRKNYLADGRHYKKCRLMNNTEQQLFAKLQTAFPDYHIFPQIPFSCIVQPRTNKPQIRQKLLWKINQKRVDFLVCNSQLESLFIVELDGASHQHKKASDLERDTFFLANQLPTLRFRTEELSRLDSVTLQRHWAMANKR